MEDPGPIQQALLQVALTLVLQVQADPSRAPRGKAAEEHLAPKAQILQIPNRGLLITAVEMNISL
jgi:hypothetical protein